MKFNNKPNRPKGRQSFFEEQLARFNVRRGEDYDFLNQIELKEADLVRILKDIANARFDINRDIKYLLDDRILYPLSSYADYKYTHYSINHFAVLQVYGNRIVNCNIASVMEANKNYYSTYTIIKSCIDALKFNKQNRINSIDPIFILINQLKNLKQYI